MVVVFAVSHVVQRHRSTSCCRTHMIMIWGFYCEARQEGEGNWVSRSRGSPKQVDVVELLTNQRVVTRGWHYVCGTRLNPRLGTFQTRISSGFQWHSLSICVYSNNMSWFGFLRKKKIGFLSSVLASFSNFELCMTDDRLQCLSGYFYFAINKTFFRYCKVDQIVNLTGEKNNSMRWRRNALVSWAKLLS